MAVARRKQVKKYKFELTRGGIGGIGVVCFCIFLWLFLLGIWTGQSLLMPSTDDFAIEDGKVQEIVNLTDQKKKRPH